MCQLPSCENEATKTWALVKVCNQHYETLRIEHAKYYYSGGKIGRLVYEQIRHLTPWG